MRLSALCVIAFSLFAAAGLYAQETAIVRAADGFQFPVGPNGTGEGYYIARGYRPNGHLGEDWNGVKGGDTDLGDPVYATAHGIVVFARNYHVGWGNVVILRHAYYEGSEVKYVDSLYGHLLDFSVHEGEQVRRGQQIGRIGNNNGMYEAHLHFEMRKNLQIGMYRSSFLRDFSNYYTPNEFVASHHVCSHPNHMVSAPINTFAPVPPPIIAGPHVETPMFKVPPPGGSPHFTKIAPLASSSSPTAARVVAAATPAPAPVPSKASKPVATNAATKPASQVAARTSSTPSKTASASGPTVKLSDGNDASETPATGSPTATKQSKKKTGANGVAATAPTKSHPAESEATATEEPTVVTRSVAAALFKHTRNLAATGDLEMAAKVAKESHHTSASDKSAVASRLATQAVAPEPILPAPPVDAAPLRHVTSGYKVDRYEDLREK